MSASPQAAVAPGLRTGVIDYGRGNLHSVENALRAAGARPVRISDPRRLDAVDAVVLPGVGAFGDCAANLREAGMDRALKDWIGAGRPYLGICLGYQLLFESSEESPGAEGLGILPGRVVRFPSRAGKIPHMGWNTIEPVNRGIECFAECPDPAYVYFVHSYYPLPDDDSIVSSRCVYGVEFAASIAVGALSATQFHPEKSQTTGQRILRNFLAAAV